MRARHPQEGRSLELIGWMRRQRRLELILVLGDGSRLLVPAAWTDLEGLVGPSGAGTLGSIEDLLAARRVLDGVLRAGRAAQLPAGGGVVGVGRDDLGSERHDDAVASGSGGVPGAGGGVVGAGGPGAPPGRDDPGGGVDRTDRGRPGRGADR